MINEHFFDDRDSLIRALLSDCESRLQTAVEHRGKASLLVSGGSTPEPLYQQLSLAPLPWSDICVALVDERWVDPSQAGSNETFVKTHLLQQQAASAQFIPMKNASSTAASGEEDCEQSYQQLPRPFDLVVLGMGPDGHTASLFPHAQGLDAALNPDREQLCAAITATPSTVTGTLTERMSLTLHGLLQSRQLHLLITGEEKLAVYKAARENRDYTQTPVSAVLNQQQVPVLVYWAP